MAGTLLHITLAQIAIKQAQIPAATQKEIQDAIDDFRLGAVLFDLPYYERLLRQGLERCLSKRDFRFNEWGDVLHTHEPIKLCHLLLKGSSRAGDRALALGALTHAAVDTVFHAEIERRVRMAPEGKTHPNRVHNDIETQMDLFVHKQLLGTTGIGDAYARKMLCLAPAPGWSALFRNAVFEIHGKTPTEKQTHAWLRGLRLFGILHSRSEFFWVTTKAAPDAERDRAAIRITEEATELSARYIEEGCAYLERPLSLRDKALPIPETDLAAGDPGFKAFLDGKPFSPVDEQKSSTQHSCEKIRCKKTKVVQT